MRSGGNMDRSYQDRGTFDEPVVSSKERIDSLWVGPETRYSLLTLRDLHLAIRRFGERSMDAVMVTGLGMIGNALSTLSLVQQVVIKWRQRSDVYVLVTS